jgi:hypothetical protein
MDNQTTEVKLKCLLLNKFKEIGMPVSYKVQYSGLTYCITLGMEASGFMDTLQQCHLN